MQVIVGGLLTAYVQQGSGPDALLLHGWGSNGASFDPIMNLLVKQYRVTVPDLPGCGASEMPKNAWSLSDYAKWSVELCSKLKIEPQLIVGHSNGGSVAIRLVGEKQLTPEKLILIGAAGIRSEQQAKKGVLQAVAKTGRPLLSLLPGALGARIRRTFYEKVVGSTDYLDAGQMSETIKNIFAEDVQECAAKIGVKTLLLYGENDDSTPPSFGQKYASLIKNSELTIVQHAGHFPHHDQPEVVFACIEKFLS